MWEIANTDHIHLLEAAFAEWREQRSSHSISYLADAGIDDYHRDRLIKQIQDNPDNETIRLLTEGERILALIGLKHSTWHQIYLGSPYYKIQPSYFFTDDERDLFFTVNALKEILTHAGSVYTTRIECRRRSLIYHLALGGFLPVGTSVRMVLDPLTSKLVDSFSRPSYDGLIIRPCADRDLPRLQDIIRRAHQHSHFFCEARFKPERVRNLFAEWIAQCASNSAYRITVAEKEGQVVGFCSSFVQKTLKSYIRRAIGIIDFIVVDYGIQGRGIGRALLKAAFDEFYPGVDCVELRTMADNLRAIRFYEKHGFRMLSADQHLHYWAT
ncbi:MAG: GNAT family N-acetyltransferase [Candidatus Omnitrophica bacterium]|nr:GNAT family N-acetyltransferase [Candidatus Omnitrophota bacterium]